MTRTGEHPAVSPRREARSKRGITTHVLDTARGAAAVGVAVLLERLGADQGAVRIVGRATTDADGRVQELLRPEEPLERGTYRMTFETASYFAARETDAFFPAVTVVFEVRDTTQHYHVPLLLSPYGYATYRGQ